MRLSTYSRSATIRTTACRSYIAACRAAARGQRYHVPPWVVPLLLDKAGDELLPMLDGEYEGRAAFFDLSLDGRWGGVISGDKISIDYQSLRLRQQGCLRFATTSCVTRTSKGMTRSAAQARWMPM